MMRNIDPRTHLLTNNITLVFNSMKSFSNFSKIKYSTSIKHVQIKIIYSN